VSSSNKQLQRTVIPNRRRGASAAFHYALAPRFPRQRAAAELRRYAAFWPQRATSSALCRFVAIFSFVACLAGCAPSVRVDISYEGGSAAAGKWRSDRLRFFERQYARSLEAEQLAYIENALIWLDRQDTFACPGEKPYSFQRTGILSVEFQQSGKRFTVFVGCSDAYFFMPSSLGYACTGHSGDYICIT